MSLRKQAFSGIVWTYSQQLGSQIITFAVSVVLARLLLPEEFGLIGMLAIFIGIGLALFDGGLTSSLIRTKELTEDDYSTVFLFNLLASLILYGLLYVTAPFIANFYQQPALTSITRVYGLTFIIGALGTVQNTILTRELRFKKQALVNIPAIILSGILGIVLAYRGFGVWSLVLSALLSSALVTVFLWLSSSWYPKIVFSKSKFKQHFYYGYKLALSNILDTIFTNIYQIVIGKVFAVAQVGYYTRANSLMMLPVGNISGALNRVIFPIFSKVQDDIIRLRNAYKQVMQMVLFIITPILVILGVLARQITVFLFTEKWLPMVSILQILCLSGVLYPIHLYNLIILQVKGRSDLFLKLEIVKKIMIALVLIITLSFGFYALLWGQLFCSILGLFINTYYAGKMLNYTMFSQLRDISPIFAFAVAMGIAIYATNHLLITQSNLVQIAGCSLLGVSVYLSFAWVCKFESIKNIQNIISKK